MSNLPSWLQGEQPLPPPPPKKPFPFLLLFLGVFVICGGAAGLGAVLWLAGPAADTAGDGPRPTQTPGRIIPGSKPPPYNEFAAWNKCTEGMRDRLERPATAEFQSFYDADIEDKGDGKYTVISHVDSEDNSGVSVIRAFICEIRYVSNGSYRITDLEIISQ